MASARHRTAATALAAAAALLALAGTAAPAAAAVPAAAPAAATGGGSLNLRDQPGTSGAVRARIPNGTALSLACQQPGQLIHGWQRTTAMWDRLSSGGYVSDAYVRRAVAPARCPAGGVGTTGTGTWTAPVNAAVGSGFRTADRPDHNGVDLVAPRSTPIRAAAAGVVITVACNASTGNCNVDGSLAVSGCGWYVEILHAAGAATRYCHLLHRPLVNVGQPVASGQIIGLVGASGNVTGPHLHFEVHAGAPLSRDNAVDPVPFLRQRGVILMVLPV